MATDWSTFKSATHGPENEALKKLKIEKNLTEIIYPSSESIISTISPIRPENKDSSKRCFYLTGPPFDANVPLSAYTTYDIQELFLCF